jgi:Spy/CpxP family protein refolding chaperone
MLIASLALTGSIFAARSMAADKPDAPPPQPTPGSGRPNNGGPGGGGPPPGGAHLIPRFAAEKLNLTDDQKTQIAALETEMKAKLAKILTADQMKTLEEARPPRGPDGQGGGPGGRGNQTPGSGNGPDRPKRPSN